MKNINNKLLSTFFLFAIVLASAQVPPNPGGGGTGGSGTGAPASPIDMYIYVLGIVAVLFIAFFTKKYSIKKI